jgi:hypothetical protein
LTSLSTAFQEVPMLLMLSIHPSRQHDLLTDHTLQFSPNVRARDFHDVFGNICTRLVAPPGLIEIRSDFTIADSSQPDDVAPEAKQWALEDLPNEALMFLFAQAARTARAYPSNRMRTKLMLVNCGLVLSNAKGNARSRGKRDLKSPIC